MTNIVLNGIRQMSISESDSSITIKAAGEKIDNAKDDYSLTYNEKEELEKYIKKNQLEKEFFVWGENTLKIINYVGYIHLSTVAIEILPKISSLDKKKAQETLFKMVEMIYKSGDEDITFTTTIGKLDDSQYNFFEIIACVFANQLKRELMKGVVSTYVPVENNQSFLRGRLLISKHIPNVIGGNGKVYCQYDEFSMDNSLNRILKQAVILLIGKVANAKTLNVLKFCLLCFADVEDTKNKAIEFDKVKIDRTNQRFLGVFNLAKLLLAGRSSLNAAGKCSSFALLFRMEELFEKYITAMLKKSSKYDEVIAQKERYLAEGEEYYFVIPDIIVKQGKNELIIDTKWKEMKYPYKPLSEDFMQMYKYLASHESADKGILLYPHVEGCENKVPLRSYKLKGINKELWICTIDYENGEKIKGEFESMIEKGFE